MKAGRGQVNGVRPGGVAEHSIAFYPVLPSIH